MKRFRKICLILLVIVTLFTLSACTDNKKQLLGTWYYEGESGDGMTIYENNELVEKDGRTGKSYTYDYTYEDGVLILYSYGFKEFSYSVKINGNKMILTSGDDTYILYKSYEKADREDEAIKESEEREAFEEYVRDLGMESTMPKLRQAEAYLESQGYYSYELNYWSHSFDDGLLIETDYPICMYVFDVWKDNIKYRAIIEYSCVNGEWTILDGGFIVE